MSILPRSEWPEGAEPDDRMYSLEVSRSMRPLMAKNDTSAEKFELDSDGKIIWVPSQPDRMIPPEFEPQTGTYRQVSALAERFNTVQTRGGNSLAWIFFPSPIDKQGAR